MRTTGARLLLQMALERKAMAAAAGARITDERMQRGWSQEEAARKVDVSARNWQKWESGEVLARPENLRAIADLFELAVSDLLGEPPRKDELHDQLNRIEQKLDGLTEALAEYAERRAEEAAGAGVPRKQARKRSAKNGRD